MTTFGRSYRAIAQADAPFRETTENIAQLKVRNGHGGTVPLGTVLAAKQSGFEECPTAGNDPGDRPRSDGMPTAN